MSARVSRFRRFRGEVTTGAGVDDVPGKRYFEGAETNRLNESHWVYASDIGVNAWLIQHLHTLRARLLYEARNNPIVAGVVQTYVVGVLGQRAPTLQVVSDDDRFNDALESYWIERRDELDVNGQLSFYDVLKQMVGGLPTCGEAIVQIVSGDRSHVALATVEPRRLESLLAFRHGENGEHTVLGIRRSRTGKPLAYTFRDWDDATGGGTFRYLDVPADQVIHVFDAEYPGQARGIPLLASSITSMAELRDFDTATLRAARTAAEHTVLLEATGPDVEYQEVDSEITVESGTMGTLPPGYKATQLAPEHPANGYVEFRHERLRETGRPLGMPLMMVLLDSQGMNYSSARYDGQVFARSAGARRSGLGRHISRIVRAVAVEGQALGRVPAAPPGWRCEWGWQPMIEVDPKKEAEARIARLGAGLTTYTEECAADGRDYLQDVLPQQAKERVARAAVGVPEIGAAKAPAESDAANEDDKDGDDDGDAEERSASEWGRLAVAFRERERYRSAL